MNDRTQEIEDTLEKMKELVNYFLEEEQSKYFRRLGSEVTRLIGKETKKKIKASYIKYLVSINYYIKKEIKEKVFPPVADGKTESKLTLEQMDSLKSPKLKPKTTIEEEEEKKAQ